MKSIPNQKTTVKIGFDIGCLHRHFLAKPSIRYKHPHKLSVQIVKERLLTFRQRRPTIIEKATCSRQSKTFQIL
jgi:hypothetical protein